MSSTDAETTNLAAAAVITDVAGRVLLVRENYGSRRWGLPGGIVEPNESPWDAVAREVLEETAITFAPRELLVTYFLPAPQPGVRFVFRGTVDTTDVVLPASGELADHGWFAADALPTPMTDTAPHAVDCARRGIAGTFETLERVSR